MKQELLYHKIPSHLIAFILIMLLSEDWVFNVFVILGQAHFIMAYTYHTKSGRMTWKYMSAFVLVLAALLAGIFYYSWEYFIILIAGTHFTLHFVMDEIKLFAQKHSLFTLLECLPVAMLFSVLEIDDLYTMEWVITAGVIISALALTAYLALSLVKKRKPNLLSYYFYAISAVLFFIILMGFSPSVLELFGYIIIVHYANWYIYYFYKLKNNKPALKVYLKTGILSNILVIGLFALYIHDFFTPVLFYLFSPTFFYLGSFMHTVFSSRWMDYKNSLSFKAAK